MVPFWVPIIIRHLLFRVPQKGTLILTTTHITPKRNYNGDYRYRHVGKTARVLGFLVVAQFCSRPVVTGH